MLLAAGLLISTQGWANLPERTTPPTEPKDVAEGVLKKEVPPTVPTLFATAPRKVVTAGEPITVLHDGVSTNYADWATMTAALEDGDEITLNADLTGNFALMKSVTLNLNEKWLKSNSGTTLSVSGNITIKNGTIQAQYTSGYGIYAISGEIQVMDVNVYSQYNPSTGYGKNKSYGPAYPLWIETGANVTVTNGFFDGYDYAAEVKGNLTLKGKADFYAWTNGIKNEFSGQVTIDGADVVVHANTHGIGNYGKVTLKQGKIQGDKYQGIYNYSQGAKITVEGGSVIGNNYGIYDAGGADYIFCRGGGIWGWATWKRTIDSWDPQYKFIEDEYSKSILKAKHGSKMIDSFIDTCLWHKSTGREYYESIRNSNQLVNDQLNIVPTKNMTCNIGVDIESTHNSANPYRCCRATRNALFSKTYEYVSGNLANSSVCR